MSRLPLPYYCLGPWSVPFRTCKLWGAWVAQLVKRPTLDLCSGYDLTVLGFEPHIELCADGVEPAWDLSLLSAPPLLVLSLKINKYT